MRGKDFVPNSSETEDNTSSEAPSVLQQAGKKVPFVVVSKMATLSTRSIRNRAAASTSSLSSPNDSSAVGSPMEFTPDTSTLNTPAPSFRGKGAVTSRSSLAESSASASNKRKRSARTLQLDPIFADEEVARRLQEEEYTRVEEDDDEEEDNDSPHLRGAQDKARSGNDDFEEKNTSWDGNGKAKGKGKGKGKVISPATVRLALSSCIPLG